MHILVRPRPRRLVPPARSLSTLAAAVRPGAVFADDALPGLLPLWYWTSGVRGSCGLLQHRRRAGVAHQRCRRWLVARRWVVGEEVGHGHEPVAAAAQSAADPRQASE